ncbi:MAG TPA: NUDIX domain-containing protein [Verrucomicrobiae bacterium]|nr:NUDIX domain-containing protein [Verrucomicrobiae bacterium]
MSRPFKFCPRCTQPLEHVTYDGVQRDKCPDTTCGFVHWNNPVPVVAAIIEHEGKVLLARNALWPAKFFGLVTGFLEKDETPEVGVLREVKEEVGLDGVLKGFVGHYGFSQMNQLIIAFHVEARGPITLNEEIAEVKLLEPKDVRPWPSGTGHAMRDWLVARGYTPEMRPFTPLVAITAFLPLGDRIGTAGQPTAEQFTLIKAEGFGTVINLALETSPGAIPGERELVASLGMDYVHIPVEFGAPQPEDFEQFLAAMDAHADKKVFVHCIANKRVSAFLFLYRVLKLNQPVPEAEMALHRLWTPDPVWQDFIDRTLRWRR